MEEGMGIGNFEVFAGKSLMMEGIGWRTDESENR
jgi:hypothetical protein